jgi:hypothetical protein
MSSPVWMDALSRWSDVISSIMLRSLQDFSSSSSSVLISSQELNDTQVYEPEIRALCEVVFLTVRTVWIAGGAHRLGAPASLGTRRVCPAAGATNTLFLMSVFDIYLDVCAPCSEFGVCGPCIAGESSF